MILSSAIPGPFSGSDAGGVRRHPSPVRRVRTRRSGRLGRHAGLPEGPLRVAAAPAEVARVRVGGPARSDERAGGSRKREALDAAHDERLREGLRTGSRVREQTSRWRDAAGRNEDDVLGDLEMCRNG